MNKRNPVVIVGAGPVGLAAANLLGSYGVETLVLERNAATVDIPRAIVLDDEGARTLQSFDAGSFVDGTIIGDGARYIDDQGGVFAAVGAGPPTYGFAKRHFMFQPELERALLANLEKFPSVKVKFDSVIVGFRNNADDAVAVDFERNGRRQTVTASWLLGCDGGRSFVREALKVEFGGSTYAQDWIVVDTLNDPDGVNYSKFFCSATRPAVSVPAPHGGRRYEFMVLDGETREEMLSDRKLSELLSPFRPFRAEDIIRRTIYTFHARIADSFKVGRVLLLGDAAHLTPPFAGQGMNAGLRDAHNVAWKIAMVERGIAADKLLDTYDLERRGPAWAMIQLAVAMGEVVMPKGAEQIRFRNLLMAAIEPFPGVRDYFLQMRFKPKPRYDDGFFVALHDQAYEASMVGEMLPQPSVRTESGATVKLDDCLGREFSIIVQDDLCEAALAGLRHPVWKRLSAKTLRLCSKAELSARRNIPRAAVENAALAKPFRTHRDQILLVRPDRYVCAAFAPHEADDIAGGISVMLSVDAAAPAMLDFAK